MRSILYLIAVILIIGWLLGLFVWHAGSIIYALLVIAVILIVVNLVRRTV
ncbi:MAG TPA: lmo0937 family membrane protein [Hanamia sp.]